MSAYGETSLSYQWQLNGTNIFAATGTNYGLTNASAANAGTYSYVASGPYGGVSASATLTLYPQPTLTLLSVTTEFQVFNGRVLTFAVNPVQSYEVQVCTNLDPNLQVIVDPDATVVLEPVLGCAARGIDTYDHSTREPISRCCCVRHDGFRPGPPIWSQSVSSRREIPPRQSPADVAQVDDGGCRGRRAILIRS